MRDADLKQPNLCILSFLISLKRTQFDSGLEFPQFPFSSVSETPRYLLLVSSSQATFEEGGYGTATSTFQSEGFLQSSLRNIAVVDFLLLLLCKGLLLAAVTNELSDGGDLVGTSFFGSGVSKPTSQEILEAEGKHPPAPLSGPMRNKFKLTD